MAGLVIRKLITKLSVDDKQAKNRLSSFNDAVNIVSQSLNILSKVTNFASNTVGKFINDITSENDKIIKTARTMGLTAEELQRLTFAAEKSGVPMTNLVKSAQNVARNLRDAIKSGGKGGFADALKQVNLNIKDFMGLNYEEQLGLLSNALLDIEDKQMRVATAQKLLGEEAGPRFASFLELGSEGIRALGDEAERLGFVLDEDVLKQSESFQDSLTEIKTVANGLKRSLAKDLVPLFQKWAKTVKGLIIDNRALIREKVVSFFNLIGQGVQTILDHSDALLEFLELSVKAAAEFTDIMVHTARGFVLIKDQLGELVEPLTTTFDVGIDKAQEFGIELDKLGVKFKKFHTSSTFNKTSGTQRERAAFRGVARGALRGFFSEGLEKNLATFSLKQLSAFRKEFVQHTVPAAIPQLLSADKSKRAKQLKAQKEAIENFDLFLDKVIFRQAGAEFGALKGKALTKAKAREKRRKAQERARRNAAKLAPKGKAKDKKVSTEELLKLIEAATLPGAESLTQLLADRRIEGGVPPVITVTLTKNEIKQDIKVNVDIPEGTQTEGIFDIIEEKVTEVFDNAIEKAVDKLTPVIAR